MLEVPCYKCRVNILPRKRNLIEDPIIFVWEIQVTGHWTERTPSIHHIGDCKITFCPIKLQTRTVKNIAILGQDLACIQRNDLSVEDGIHHAHSCRVLMSRAQSRDNDIRVNYGIDHDNAFIRARRSARAAAISALISSMERSSSDWERISAKKRLAVRPRSKRFILE